MLGVLSLIMITKWCKSINLVKSVSTGGSRISRRGTVDPFWGGGGGVYLRCWCFSVKMYVKTKELGPVGGGAPEKLVYRSANG